MLFSGAAAAPARYSANSACASSRRHKERTCAERRKSFGSISNSQRTLARRACELEPAAKSSLADEQLKFSVARASRSQRRRAFLYQELIEREKQNASRNSLRRKTAAETVTARKKSSFRAAAADVREEVPVDEEQSTEEGESGSSSKGILIAAIAASVLLAGGGWCTCSDSPVASVPVQCRVECAGFLASLPVASSHRNPRGMHCSRRILGPIESGGAHQYCRPIQFGAAHQHFRPVQFGPATLTAVREAHQPKRHTIRSLRRIRKRRSSCDDIGCSPAGCGTAEEAYPWSSSSRQTQGLAKPQRTEGGADAGSP